jgi:hypothetical protein
MATMRKTLSDKRWNAQPIFSVKMKKPAPRPNPGGFPNRRYTNQYFGTYVTSSLRRNALP